MPYSICLISWRGLFVNIAFTYMWFFNQITFTVIWKTSEVGTLHFLFMNCSRALSFVLIFYLSNNCDKRHLEHYQASQRWWEIISWSCSRNTANTRRVYSSITIPWLFPVLLLAVSCTFTMVVKTMTNYALCLVMRIISIVRFGMFRAWITDPSLKW